MKPIFTSLSFLILGVSPGGPAPSVYAQQVHIGTENDSATALRHSVDPGDTFLAAYRLIREAEQLARNKRFNAALRKGVSAERMLAAIARDYPHWRKELVSTRRRLLAESMQSYRKQAEEMLHRIQDADATTPPNFELTGYDTSPGTGRFVPEELPGTGTGNRRLYDALARAQEECRRMAKAYRELYSRFTEVRQALTAAQNEKDTYKRHYEDLRDQVSAERRMGNNVIDSLNRRLTETEAKYRDSEDTLRRAEERCRELEDKLAETEQKLRKVTEERDTLANENEKLRAIAELNTPEKIKALLDQNLTLAEQLKTAQQRVAELEAAQSGTSDQQAVLEQQLEQARSETTRLQEELRRVYDENMGYRRRISELTTQLNNLEVDLSAADEVPPPDPALQEENNLLRSLIEKQRTAIAMQEQSRRLLIDAYGKSKGNSPEVTEALRKLQEESSPALTAEEQRMLDEIRRGISHARTDSSAADRARVQAEARTLANLAQIAFDKQRYDSAEQMYLTLHDLQPDHPAALINLGTILLYNNKNEESLTYLQRAVRLSPQLSVSHYLTGIAYYRLERFAEARNMFVQAVQLDPGSAEAFFYLANIESLTGAVQPALRHYAAAVKIDNSLADAHYNMARLYAELDRLPDAARAYDRAMHDGAMPDAEFEQFLRSRQELTRHTPGSDLVHSVHPEDEAKKLSATEEKSPEAPTPDDPQALTQDPPGPTPEGTLLSPQEQTLDAFNEKLQQVISARISAVRTPSPAGAGYLSPKERFADIHIRTRKGLIPLRLKRREPRCLRERGQEDIRPLRRALRSAETQSPRNRP